MALSTDITAIVSPMSPGSFPVPVERRESAFCPGRCVARDIGTYTTIGGLSPAPLDEPRPGWRERLPLPVRADNLCPGQSPEVVRAPSVVSLARRGEADLDAGPEANPAVSITFPTRQSCPLSTLDVRFVGKSQGQFQVEILPIQGVVEGRFALTGAGRDECSVASYSAQTRTQTRCRPGRSNPQSLERFAGGSSHQVSGCPARAIAEASRLIRASPGTSGPARLDPTAGT
jgi:hypothetical protein